MRKSQFTDAQIVAILQQAGKGEQTNAEACRQHNVSENSFYRWRSRFGSATATEAARLRELEEENARLKRLLAERDLEMETSDDWQAGKAYLTFTDQREQRDAPSSYRNKSTPSCL